VLCLGELYIGRALAGNVAASHKIGILFQVVLLGGDHGESLIEEL